MALVLAVVVLAGAVVLTLQPAVFSEGSAPAAFLQKGLDLHRQGRYEEAVAEFSRLIDSNGDPFEAYVFRGIALHNAGRFDEAIRDFSSALESDPESLRVLLYRGESYVALGQPEAAKADFQAVVEAASADDGLATAARAKLQAMGR